MDYIDVLNEYGANGPAVAAAVAAANSTQKLLVFRGNNAVAYQMGTTPLTFSGGYKVTGDGRAQLLWSDDSMTGTLVTLTGAMKMEGIAFERVTHASLPLPANIGMDVQAPNCQLDDVFVGAFGTDAYNGLYTAIQFGQWAHIVNKGGFAGQVYGLVSTANAIELFGVQASALEDNAASGAGMYFKKGYSVGVNGCDVEGGSSYNILVSNLGRPGDDIHGVSIRGYTEGCCNASICLYGDAANRIRGITVPGGSYSGNNVAPHGLYALNTDGLVTQGGCYVQQIQDSIYCPTANNSNSLLTPNSCDKPIVT